MSERNAGRHGGFLSIGEVVNVENDPTQSGRVQVRWLSGAATQNEISDEDLPWTSAMFPSTNPAIGQTGGPHTGLRKGSRVVGIPLDGSGQNFMIMGSMVKTGDGGPDQAGTIDSDIPQAAKTEDNGGEKQPRYGDVNAVVCQKSIIKYAEEEGGPDKKAGRFCSLDDPIGTLDNPII